MNARNERRSAEIAGSFLNDAMIINTIGKMKINASTRLIAYWSVVISSPRERRLSPGATVVETVCVVIDYASFFRSTKRWIIEMPKMIKKKITAIVDA